MTRWEAINLSNFLNKTYSEYNAYFIAFVHFPFGLSNVIQSVLCKGYHFVNSFEF